MISGIPWRNVTNARYSARDKERSAPDSGTLNGSDEFAHKDTGTLRAGPALGIDLGRGAIAQGRLSCRARCP
ncbi:hypothetical protein GCM10023085_41400 [Actinomadura viridis]